MVKNWSPMARVNVRALSDSEEKQRWDKVGTMPVGENKLCSRIWS